MEPFEQLATSFDDLESIRENIVRLSSADSALGTFLKTYSDYDQMLKHEGLEAVVVATVTTAHAEQSIKAIKAGKHVLCEKPFSTKLEVVCPLPTISIGLQH